jgi:methylglutaconyl-CoA hydratase
MSSVLTETRDGVFHLRLNRPAQRNALDEGLLEGLLTALGAAPRDPGVRAVVLEGEGRSFCAGADIEWMRRQGEADAAANENSARRLALLYEAVAALPLPVIARVQGSAVGGGCGLVAAADLAVAARDAVFALPEVRLGILPAVISPYLVDRVGSSRARDWMLTGRRVAADEALQAGLVHRLADLAELDAAVAAVVRDLLAGGPRALERTKGLLRDLPALRAAGTEVLAARTVQEIAAARQGPEGRAGLTAFLDKRRPPWVKGDA